jgi:hypothetical protein
VPGRIKENKATDDNICNVEILNKNDRFKIKDKKRRENVKENNIYSEYHFNNRLVKGRHKIIAVKNKKVSTGNNSPTPNTPELDISLKYKEAPIYDDVPILTPNLIKTRPTMNTSNVKEKQSDFSYNGISPAPFLDSVAKSKPPIGKSHASSNSNFYSKDTNNEVTPEK